MKVTAHWASERLFHSGDAYFAGLARDIRSARHSIDLETYIFADDSLGDLVAMLLSEAARRGVRVRVLVDGAGSPAWARRYLPALAKAGVETRVYHPLPGLRFPGLETFLHPRHSVLRALRNLNRRNHRKVCVIDGRIAWAGSLNVTSEHLASARRPGSRDTGVRVEGAPIAELLLAFERAWHRGPLKPPAGALHPLVRLNDSRAKRGQAHRDLLRRVRRARHRVWITNAYFVPQGSLLRALRAAASRGVDVRVLVPSKSDVFFMPWVTAAFYGGLLEAGARIYEYQAAFLHAKNLVIDEWACVGSTNFNSRSYIHDLEVDVVLGTRRAKHGLDARFKRDLARSREITLTDWRRLPWSVRVGGSLFLLLKYWI